MQRENKIIDMHAHILPGVDDGSRNREETKKLLQQAYRQGICGMIATPHYTQRQRSAGKEQLLEVFQNVQMMAGEISPDLKIYLGQELFYHDGLADVLADGRALTLNETDYVLVEFSVAVGFQELFKAVRKLTQACYIPVLAHVERYKCLRKSGNLEELIRMGAYAQMNFSSLSGFTHLKDRAWCRKMVLEDNIHLFGTDLHRTDFRPPQIASAVAWLEHKLGREYFEEIAYDRPLRLLNGEGI